MDDKFGELKKNTIIIAVSNIGSRAILFMLAPLYSYFLSKSQYGTMDLITTTVSLLGPLFCLDIYEATFRFASDSEEEKRTVYSSSMAVCFLGLVMGLVVIAASIAIGKNSNLIVFTVLFTVLTVLNNVMSQFARGQGAMKTFALSGIVNAIFLLASNVVFLYFLHMELRGWLLSYFIAKIITFLYLFWRTDFIHCFSVKYVDQSCIRRMLKYCIPLMPTAIMWWIMNMSDRYMLTFFLGTAVTGVYAVAGKIPSILSVFENIFYQAWQTTAIKSLMDKNREALYSDVLGKYIEVIALGCVMILIVLRPFIEFLFAEPYHPAVGPAPILVLCIAIHAVAGNLGALYTVFKVTRGALFTSFAGAVVNIGLNLIFIPRYGMVGAALTTIIGYTVTLLLRWFDIRHFVKLKLNAARIAVALLVLLVQFALYYNSSAWSYLVRCLIAAVFLFMERGFLLSLLRRR